MSQLVQILGPQLGKVMQADMVEFIHNLRSYYLFLVRQKIIFILVRLQGGWYIIRQEV